MPGCSFRDSVTTTTLPSPASHRYGALVAFLAVTFAAAAIGSAATFKSVGTWYPTLIKPAWNPPAWIFGPVWTTLYFAMAVAAWRVWRLVAREETGAVLRLYGFQLVLNALWSVLFFGLQKPGWALAEIILFWIVLIAILRRFWRVDPVAGVLWSAYVGWVTFATALNSAIWALNRG
jgi:benzodiazapine receptor